MPNAMAVSKATMRTIINGLSPIYISVVCWMGWVLWALFLFIRARCVETVRGRVDETSAKGECRETLTHV